MLSFPLLLKFPTSSLYYFHNLLVGTEVRQKPIFEISQYSRFIAKSYFQPDLGLVISKSKPQV